MPENSYSDAAPSFFEWVERAHPEWLVMAKARGGTAYVEEMVIAEAAWSAAVCAAMNLLYVTPIRDLYARMNELYPPPPMG